VAVRPAAGGWVDEEEDSSGDVSNVEKGKGLRRLKKERRGDDGPTHDVVCAVSPLGATRNDA
jgi:hypothetical protein